MCHVSKTHLPISEPTAPRLTAPLELSPASPAASRRDSKRWRDPRLWIGVLLVLLSVAVGAKLMAAADDTVAVWRFSHDLDPGATLTSGDLEQTMVHFADDALTQAYLLADDPLPAETRLVTSVSAGELVARSALSLPGATTPDELPLTVSPAGLPGELHPGDLVDVWAVPAQQAGPTPPVEVFTAVTVSSVTVADQVSLGADRHVSVALPPAADVGRALASLNGASVVLVSVGDR